MKETRIPRTGVILASEPLLNDSYFKKAVVIITEHDMNGSLGLILNKPTDVKLNDAVEEFPYFNVPLYFGGPIDTDTLFYVHTLGDVKLPGSKKISDDIYWGGDYDQLKFLIGTGQVHESEIRFYAGYSGWDACQLDEELEDRTWFASEHIDKQIVFYKEEPKKLWHDFMARLENPEKLLSNFPENPNDN